MTDINDARTDFLYILLDQGFSESDLRFFRSGNTVIYTNERIIFVLDGEPHTGTFDRESKTIEFRETDYEEILEHVEDENLTSGFGITRILLG